MAKPTPKPLKPYLPFLFGRQEQLESSPSRSSPLRTKRVASAAASSQPGLESQDLASIAHSHPHPPPTPTTKTNNLVPQPQSHLEQNHPRNGTLPHRLSLDLALQFSARSSIDSNCSDLLDDPIPLTFAPTMAASPAGGGHS